MSDWTESTGNVIRDNRLTMSPTTRRRSVTAFLGCSIVLAAFAAEIALVGAPPLVIFAFAFLPTITGVLAGHASQLR